MKKILIVFSIILLLAFIGFGIFYFFGNGKEKVANFFSDNTFGSFFDVEPQSQNDILDVPIDIEENQNPTKGPYVAPTLRQISFEPISGYTFYSTSSSSTQNVIPDNNQKITQEFLATSTAIRFQERATGHIYDVFEFIEMPQKVSNITEQKIYSTLFSNNKDQFLFQTLTYNNEQIKTTLGKLLFSTSTGIIMSKSDISSSISDFIFNKFSNKIIYSVKQNGLSSIYTSNIDKTGEKLITTLYFNDFLIDSINTTDVLITTKASQVAPGYAYTLNTTSGALTKILGNIPGLLVKVSPDKKYYIYSSSEQNRPSVRLYNSTTGSLNILTFDSLPSEKCIFSQKNASIAYCFGSTIYKTAKYPDDWYKGKVLNYESLYKINLTEKTSTTIYSFEGEDLILDAMNIQLTDDERFIVFQNKYNLTLWSLDLSKLSNELN